MRYILYNNDKPIADFEVNRGTIESYTPLEPRLLPMQLCGASADGFTLWLQERSIDLNSFQHRQLTQELLGSRDKVAISLMTHMFSISDTFTCFAEDEAFVPRAQLLNPDDQDRVSDFILVSSDTSLGKSQIATPNVSTDGGFTKTWKFEAGEWWLYKLQSPEATRSEREISRALISAGWDAAEYQYIGNYRTRIRSRNFVQKNEFFEPYDSLRFMFEDRSDNGQIIYSNISSLGCEFERAWRRILLADALFMNTDRHMRNFGVIRSAVTGEILRIAPNFDNNQAYRANPSGRYSGAMLRQFAVELGMTASDKQDIAALLEACAGIPYLEDIMHIAPNYI